MSDEVPRVLSVDVEDYFQVEAFSDVVDRSHWADHRSRVEWNTHRLLDLFDEVGVEGTFFVLGWVATRFPGLVREIAARGHEIACHSYWHRLIFSLSPQEFADDTKKAIDAIEQASGTDVVGYRAPSFSITARSLWAFDVLAEAGIIYDSSVFPIQHDVYGLPMGPRRPVRVMTASGPVYEFPMTTFTALGGRRFPVGGGGYLRLLPFWYTSFGVKAARNEGVPLIVYIHPWEIDAEQPRLHGRWRSRLRHYTNLDKTLGRLRKIIAASPLTSFRRSGLYALASDVTPSQLEVHA